MQKRNKKGQFGSKSDSNRKVRSLRTTDDAWEKLGKMANERGITRADLIEEFANGSQLSNTRYDDRIKLLKEALKLKANAGGAIKKKIREYLSLLQQ